MLWPLPRFQEYADVMRFAKQMGGLLAVTTFYGAVFALVGNLAAQAAISVFIKAFLG